ncbi:TetR family transcriptional regulator [Mycobacterium sp. 1465703.0]|uniref:TetR family transcriptional regulator n=1 Tax=Mycobacterium sp. 1465703.0 TaxID=1834078 RepID=UPI0007FBD7AE|nr:TetR family transcriptional regulator [Mycobacterium sp. 1465703.0]OBJ10838.1 hypothetical protein A5625_10225 [Mycobacterium sp. 1465703.0]
MVAEGLVERRRQQTAYDIHVSALELVREFGFDAVTVDAIAAKARISRRTFFNYYPTKEAAMVQSPELPIAAIAEALDGRVASPREVFIAVVDLMADALEEHHPHRQNMRCMLDVASSHPTVLAALMARIDMISHKLIEVVAPRMGMAVDAEEPALIAALASTAVRVGVEHWANEPENAEPSSPAMHTRRTATLISAMFSAKR